MASKKFLRKAAANFRRNEPHRYAFCGFLCDRIAALIRKKGVTEVTVGVKNGVYYEEA